LLAFRILVAMSRDTESRIVEKGADTMATAPRQELVDVATAREELGGISRATLYRLAHDGELPMIKVRRRTFFRRRDLESFIARQGEAA
jgi:excisionase family DNA binding protein